MGECLSFSISKEERIIYPLGLWVKPTGKGRGKCPGWYAPEAFETGGTIALSVLDLELAVVTHVGELVLGPLTGKPKNGQGGRREMVIIL